MSRPCSALFVLLFFIFILKQNSAGAQNKVAGIKPALKGGEYVITLGDQEMVINPAIGGRIVSLKLDGVDFLTDSTVNNFNWGSTFWFSPQSDWNWPPSAAIDNKPYRAEVIGNVLRMTSSQDPKTGLTVMKEIAADPKKGSFILKYTITNQSQSVQKVAPWEVTRVKPGGIAFFPAGKDEARGGLLPSTATSDGIFWYTYQKEKLPSKGDRQIYADGSEGWLAQVNHTVILIKKFPDIPVAETAPKEGEVELFASEVSAVNAGYVEIEHQGAYQTLPPGGSSVWETTWMLRKLPAGINALTGNKALTAFVRKLVK